MAKARKFITGVKTLWLILGVTLLLFLSIEGGLALVFLAKDSLVKERPLARQVMATDTADTYSDTSWVKGYRSEFLRLDGSWTPYVYWRRNPFQGRYINIDSDGLRLTPGAAPSGRNGASAPITVFLFGGSTMWGTGVRDGDTIPAMLVRDLENDGVGARAVNFGESGYVSTQELIALLLQLQRGNRPDVVVFYDGVNDTYSAYQQRVAGLPQNESHRSQEFNLSNPEKLSERSGFVLRDTVRRLATMRFLDGIVRLVGGREEDRPVPQAFPGRTISGNDDMLAAEVVRTYLANVRIIEALGERYGFRCLFYWQPTIFAKRTLTAYERRKRVEEADLERFYETTDHAMRRALSEAGQPPVRNLSGIFTETTEPIYVDWAHLGERGNEAVAREIARDVRALIAGGDGPPTSPGAPRDSTEGR